MRTGVPEGIRTPDLLPAEHEAGKPLTWAFSFQGRDPLCKEYLEEPRITSECLGLLD
jgi:hypothetical protein